jgi:hypothetical protein
MNVARRKCTDRSTGVILPLLSVQKERDRIECFRQHDHVTYVWVSSDIDEGQIEQEHTK